MDVYACKQTIQEFNMLRNLQLNLLTLCFLILPQAFADNERKILIDESVTTEQTTTINGKKINYKATIGMQPYGIKQNGKGDAAKY